MLNTSLDLARGTDAYPRFRHAIPEGSLRAGRYALRFARCPSDLVAVQRLRYQVFNEELGEGLASSAVRGLDEDAVDQRCHHLMVLDHATGEVVGTYRVMLGEAARSEGFYSESEFDLSSLPEHVVAGAVEAGRACVAAAHRNGRVVHLLWRGLATYLAANRRRYLFGCCSVPTLDPAAGSALFASLARGGALHPDLRVAVQPAYRCALVPRHADAEVAMPPLFASYLKLGATVLGGPAIDHAFGVTDFFVLLDVDALEPHVRRSFFERSLGLPVAARVAVGDA